MQQFTVPQFIDVEDKIIGPVTARQFVIMLGGSLLTAICYKLLAFTAFLAAGMFIMGSCGVLAFFKVNGMPFHFFILNFFQTLGRPGLRVWNKMVSGFQNDLGEKAPPPRPATPVSPTKVYAASRLAELSLIVDTRGAYRGEGEEKETAVKFRAAANTTSGNEPNSRSKK